MPNPLSHADQGRGWSSLTKQNPAPKPGQHSGQDQLLGVKVAAGEVDKAESLFPWFPEPQNPEVIPATLDSSDRNSSLGQPHHLQVGDRGPQRQTGSTSA